MIRSTILSTTPARGVRLGRTGIATSLYSTFFLSDAQPQSMSPLPWPTPLLSPLLLCAADAPLSNDLAVVDLGVPFPCPPDVPFRRFDLFFFFFAPRNRTHGRTARGAAPSGARP